MMKTLAIALILFITFSAPCRATESPPPPPVKIVASFSILADMIQQVGGDAVQVETLVGPEQDAHTFQPSPQDAIKLAKADIIAINGLKFEGWMGRLIKAAGTKAKLLVASAGVRPRILQGNDAHHHGHEDDHHETGDVVPDPHAWQDLRNAQTYIKNISAALIQARPSQAAFIKERTEAYIARCAALDKEARGTFSDIPKSKRKVITNHDAFGYFAAAYGLTFHAPVGLSTESEPSPATLAKLVDQIKREQITTLFLENKSDPRLIQSIAKETGASVGGTLYTDSLSDVNGEAPTYLDMMRSNITKISSSMQ